MTRDPKVSPNDRAAFFATHYETIGAWVLRPGQKVLLGDKQNNTCRFCEKSRPEVTFSKGAHAIPESLGNKSLESTYECDACNEIFGSGIENDLGNWSKPLRTMLRIRGKRGVPTLKKGGDGPGWRIEYDDTGFYISSYENDPIFELDEVNQRVLYTLRRDSYTTVGVLKAFMKIGLTLMPDEEISNFKALKRWILCADHSRTFADRMIVLRISEPGPMPTDVIRAWILRRKPQQTRVPYTLLVLNLGNETYQVALPAPSHDAQLVGEQVTVLPYPTPTTLETAFMGPPAFEQLSLSGRDVIRGDTLQFAMGYERMTSETP